MRTLNSDHMGLQCLLDGLLGLLAGIALGFVLLTTCSCAAAKKAPELVPAPVVHVAPAPPVPPLLVDWLPEPPAPPAWLGPFTPAEPPVAV